MGGGWVGGVGWWVGGVGGWVGWVGVVELVRVVFLFSVRLFFHHGALMTCRC